MKTFLSLVFIWLSISATAQLAEIKLFPGDSSVKLAISEANGTLYCISTLQVNYSFDLYKSTDNGATWSFLNHCDENLVNFKGMVSFNDSCHIAVGKHVLFKTEDAFDSIQFLEVNYNLFPTTIKAINRDTIVVYNLDRILVSYDGLVTYTTIEHGDVLPTKAVFSSDDVYIINDTVWIAFLDGSYRLVKTTDAGQTWHLIKDFSMYNFCDEEMSAYFYSENDGLMYMNNALHVTHDCGFSFQQIHKNTYGQYTGMRAFTSGWYYYISNKDCNYRFYYSSNYGARWDSLDYSSSPPCNAMYQILPISDSILLFNTYAYLLKLDLSSTAISSSTKAVESIPIFPNPSADIIRLDLADVTGKKYSIYNQTGQLISHGKTLKSSGEIDVSTYSSGVYFITLYGKDEIPLGYGKFVKL
jgi:hypothetical protein